MCLPCNPVTLYACHMCANTWASRARAHTHIHTHVRPHMHAHTHMHTHVHNCTPTRPHTRACTHIYTYTHKISTQTSMRTHACAHIFTQAPRRKIGMQSLACMGVQVDLFACACVWACIYSPCAMLLCQHKKAHMLRRRRLPLADLDANCMPAAQLPELSFARAPVRMLKDPANIGGCCGFS